LLTITSACIYLYVSPEIFESRSVIQIGQMAQVVQLAQGTNTAQGLPTLQSLPIESPSGLVVRLKEQYRVNDSSEGAVILPLLSSVEIERGNPEILILKARAYSPAEAKAFLTGVTVELIARHDKLLNADRSREKNEIERLHKQIALIDKEINILGDVNGVSATFTTNQILDYRLKLEEKLVSAEKRISEPYQRPTRILREPTQPVEPARNAGMIIAGAALGGLVFGIILAVMQSVFQNGNGRRLH